MYQFCHSFMNYFNYNLNCLLLWNFSHQFYCFFECHPGCVFFPSNLITKIILHLQIVSSLSFNQEFIFFFFSPQFLHFFRLCNKLFLKTLLYLLQYTFLNSNTFIICFKPSRNRIIILDFFLSSTLFICCIFHSFLPSSGLPSAISFSFCYTLLQLMLSFSLYV